MNGRTFRSQLLLVTAFAVAAVAPAAAARPLRRDVLGLRLEMTKEQVHKWLGKGAQLEREEHGRQEVWTLLSHANFAWLLVGYDKAYRVRYVTAIARPGSRATRYGDV